VGEIKLGEVNHEQISQNIPMTSSYKFYGNMCVTAVMCEFVHTVCF
jgi:hypothetical protein